MTTPTRPRRQRRRTPEDDILPSVAAWFAGGPKPHALVVCAFPAHYLVQGWWLTWKKSHPDATPPKDFEWMDGPLRYDLNSPDNTAHFRMVLESAHAQWPDWVELLTKDARKRGEQA